MPDILVVKCNMFLPYERLQSIANILKAQKEIGIVVLPPYFEALIVPDNIKIKFIDRNG